MQSYGGYNWRPLTWTTLLIFTAVVGIIFLVAWVKTNFMRAFCLGLNLEGTLLWVCSLSPEGGVPPQGNWKERISWFFKLAKGYPVTINPKWLCCGIIFIFISAIVQSFFQF